MTRRRLVAVVGGSAVALAGVGAALLGAVAVGLESDCATTVLVDGLALRSPTPAISVGAAELEGELWSSGLFCDAPDRLELGVAADGVRGKRLFLGLAPAQAVERYLARTVHDQASVDLTVEEAAYRRRGAARRGSLPRPPAQEGFWTQEATGTRVTLSDSAPVPGRYELVLANADGSAPVAAATRWELGRPSGHSGDFLVLGGVATLVVGGAVALGGGRGRR